MKSKRHLASTSLSVEPLERRYLLTAAIGSFTRTYPTNTYPTELGAAAVSIASAGETFVDPKIDYGEVLAQVATQAYAASEVGSALARNEETSSIPTEYQQTTTVPAASQCVESEIIVSGASAGGITQYGGGGTADIPVGSDFLFDAPTGSEHLVFHGQLWISATADISRSGGGAINYSTTHVKSVISDPSGSAEYSLQADLVYDNTLGAYWSWSYNLAGTVDSDTTLGSTNPSEIFMNLPFTIEDFETRDGYTLSFDADSYAEMSAGTGTTPGTINVDVMADSAAWGYVLPANEQLTPGDFNADGAVDELDLALLGCAADICEQNPQADGNLDGKVDELDYDIWVDNAAAQGNAIVVTLNTDEMDGNYAANDISLREAIALAADANHPGRDIIVFDDNVIANNNHTVDVTLGTLVVGNTNEISIIGPGPDKLTIDRNDGATLFQVNGRGPATIESTIACLTLTGTSPTGVAVVHADGNNRHHLVLDHLEIVSNGYGVSGGTISELTIVDSLIANNSRSGIIGSASGDYAGNIITVIDSTIRDNGWNGIDIFSVDTTISGTEISGNNAASGSAYRSGIQFSTDDSPGATLTVTNSTISETMNSGRGITLYDYTSANIVNSTISSNTGVGMVVAGATASLTNLTVANNTAQPSQTGSVRVGGIYAGSGSTVTLKNTIVAENWSGTTSPVYADLGKASTGSFNSSVSEYNLIGAIEGSIGISDGVLHNIVLGDNVAAGLMALGDYGGRTRTHALLLSSLAVDGGNDAAISEMYDQRGFGFDRIVDRDLDDPDQNGDGDIDIGAFELGLGELYG